MTILPEPAHFEKHEYAKLRQEYPHVETVLAAPFLDKDGKAIPLVKTTEREEVLIYIGLLSEEQKKQLGDAALRAIHKQLRKSGKTRKPLVLVGIVITSLMIGALLFVEKEALKDALKNFFKRTPTPTPTATVTPTVPISATPTPTPEPSATPLPPEATPTPKTAIPTPTPTATPTPKTATPTPPPTATPTPKTATPTPPPTATPPSKTATPTPPPTATSTPPIVLRIRQPVVLRDENGLIVPLIDGKYAVKVREKVRLEVNVENPANHAVRLTYAAIKGKIGADGVYVAPDKAGGKDIVTIKIEDRNAGKIVQESIVIEY